MTQNLQCMTLCHAPLHRQQRPQLGQAVTSFWLLSGLDQAAQGMACQSALRALNSNGSAPASHLGSGSRSMRRLPTMGLMDRSDGCQMSCSMVGCPGVALRTTGAAAQFVLVSAPRTEHSSHHRIKPPRYLACQVKGPPSHQVAPLHRIPIWAHAAIRAHA